MKRKNFKRKIYLLLSVMFIVTLFFRYESYAKTESTNIAATVQNSYLYLSDIEYTDINGYTSYTGWNNIQKDKNPDGNTIKIRKDGEIVSYPKGMGFHARGQLVYNLSKYSNTYTQFIAKVGVDASKGEESCLTVEVFVSHDGKEWKSLFKSEKLSSSMNAVDLNLNIEGYQYLRIYADPVGVNYSDHCVLADAKLATKDYDVSSEIYNKIKTIKQYDEILSKDSIEKNYKENKRLILEREFVNRFGYWNLQNLASSEKVALDAMNWILSDTTVLEQVIQVGEITDSYKFLNALGSLYNEYQKLKTDVNWPVYQKMMIGLSAAYSSDNIASPLIFSHYTANYDVIERFDMVKKLFEENKFINKEQFKSLKVELMRMVMQDAVRKDEIMWFQAYTRDENNVFKKKGFYLKYISPNYNQDEAFDMANKDTFSKKYNLEAYQVPFGDGRTQRYWMAFEYGGICWNSSRMGQSAYRVNGIPATGVYQPGHEAFVYYNETEDGLGYWKMENNIGGWGAACTKWYGGNRFRLLLDWGNKSFADQIMNGSSKGNSSGYIILAQANINNYEKYKESSYFNLLANSYENNNKKVEIYKKALEISNNINLDSYDALIKTYQSMGDAVSENTWFTLANQIIDSYTFYPNAMYDLLGIIKPYLKEAKRAEIDMKERNALERAANATKEDSIQVDEIKNIANALLGKDKSAIATFSFDGENAGKIVIGEQYSIKWQYSLDGGSTYSKKITDQSFTLSNDELEKITAENDIKIAIEGTEMIYTIDILKSTLPQTDGHAYLYANDLENRVVGVDDSMEWRYEKDNNWTSYKEASPILTGDVTVYVRMGYTKNYVPSDAEKFTFTVDKESNSKRKYIPVSHLSIEKVSSEAVSNAGSASNSIDGNYNTRWHSAWNGTDKERYIIVKLDKATYLSAVEFVPAGGGNGRIVDGTIYGSMDGEKWEKLAEKKNIQYEGAAQHQNDYDFGLNHIQTFEIEKPKQIQYVKIVADTASNGNWFAARMFNFYQDITLDTHPTAGIAYSTTKPTNKDVIARLVNLSPEGSTITSEGKSDTYVFTQNGEFTFTFEDELGRKGSATASVNWIDKEVKDPEVEYTTKTLTNGSVVVTLKPTEAMMIINDGNFKLNEEGKIVSEDGSIVVEDFSMDENYNIINDSIITDEEDDDDEEHIIATQKNFQYEFFTNGTHTFYYIDRAGNVGSKTIKVDWIDNTPPEAILTYDITHITNKDVTVKLEFNEENVKIINNNQKDTYTFTQNDEFTFEIEDAAGNANTATAVVYWIDKEAPKAKIEYSTQDSTEGVVTATLVDPSEEISIVNNNHIDSYTFTKNDTFTFIIEDNVGNRNEIKAEVNWIESNREDDLTSDQYEVEKNHHFIKKVPINVEVSEFVKHIYSRRGFVVRDKNQDSILNTTKITTGMKVSSGEQVYTTIVACDLDGDGDLTINDITLFKLNYIEEEQLTGVYLEAAEIDNDGQMTINDLVKMFLYYNGEENL